MYRRNDQHLQQPLFSSLSDLPKKQRQRLEDSWAGSFYREFFVRLDEDLFAVLYSGKPSRPNIAVNVLIGLEVLKAGFGWSDAELYEAFCFNLQVRYALGYRDLSAGHFELRTLYNFRRALTEHMQSTGENLIEKAFEQITAEQLDAFALQSGMQRMDSTPIASNIRAMSRLQLLVEVLQRVHRMLNEADQQHYADDFAPYLKGSSGQYLYHLKGEATAEHLQRMGPLMQRLVEELAATYADERAYRVLQRVFDEHFIVETDALRLKRGSELSAASLQSPDDWEASYRQKRGESQVGYIANVSETCAPENDLQLIVKVQVAPNNIDDAKLLAEALPDLKARTDVDQLHTDGGYNSSDVDDRMRELQVEQIQTAIRGRSPATGKLSLQDFEWQTDEHGQPETVTCPEQQQVEVLPGRKDGRFLAYFSGCESCPVRDQCPTSPNKRQAQRVLRFSQHDLDLALRRQRSARARSDGQNLRAAVEATMRSIKHPFGNGKLPVRGQPRVSMLMVASAVMVNIRRIWRYKLTKMEQAEQARAEKSQQNGQMASPQPTFALSIVHWVCASIRHFRATCQPAPAYL